MKILVSDFSRFEVGRHNNGGQYGFSREYEIIPGSEIAVVKHYTTAEFSLCPGCGSWDEEREHSCDGIVPVTRVIDDIISIMDTADRDLWCQNSFVSISVDGRDVFRRNGN